MEWFLALTFHDNPSGMSFQEWQFSRRQSHLFLSNLPLDTFSTFLEQWQYLNGTVVDIETKGENSKAHHILLWVLAPTTYGG